MEKTIKLSVQQLELLTNSLNFCYCHLRSQQVMTTGMKELIETIETQTQPQLNK